jgi:hypothetical protein
MFAILALLSFLTFGLCIDPSNAGDQDDENVEECAVLSEGGCSSPAVLSRHKRYYSGIDLEKLRVAVITPSSISNQFTSAFVFHAFMATGWTIGGRISNF